MKTFSEKVEKLTMLSCFVCLGSLSWDAIFAMEKPLFFAARYFVQKYLAESKLFRTSFTYDRCPGYFAIFAARILSKYLGVSLSWDDWVANG